MLARLLKQYKEVTYLVFPVNSITSGWSLGAASIIVAPVGPSLSIGTIPGHVSCVATNPTNNVRGEIALLGTVVFAMSNLTTCKGVRVRYCIVDVRTDKTYSSGMLGSRHLSEFRSMRQAHEVGFFSARFGPRELMQPRT